MALKPTPRQLDLAKELGIDTEGLSRSALSENITHVIRRNKEVPRTTSSGTKRRSGIQRLTDVVRNADVKKSDIVSYNDKPYVLHSLELNGTSLIPVEGGRWRVIQPIAYASRKPRCVLTRVYRPPATHLHHFLAVSTVLQMRMLSDFGKTTLFEAFLENNLTSEERLPHRFGAFWEIAGVERCLNAFLQAKRDEESSQTVSSKKTFCTACGQRTYLRRGGSASLIRCKECQGTPLGDERYCRKCGIRFTKVPGLAGAQNTLCDSHRRKHEPQKGT